MKIEVDLDIENKEELIDALNDSILALHDIRTFFLYHIIDRLPKRWIKFLKMHNNNFNECIKVFNKRLNLLKGFYDKLKEEGNKDEIS